MLHARVRSNSRRALFIRFTWRHAPASGIHPEELVRGYASRAAAIARHRIPLTIRGGGTGNYNTSIGMEAFAADGTGGFNTCLGDFSAMEEKANPAKANKYRWL